MLLLPIPRNENQNDLIKIMRARPICPFHLLIHLNRAVPLTLSRQPFCKIYFENGQLQKLCKKKYNQLFKQTSSFLKLNEITDQTSSVSSRCCVYSSCQTVQQSSSKNEDRRQSWVDTSYCWLQKSINKGNHTSFKTIFSGLKDIFPKAQWHSRSHSEREDSPTKTAGKWHLPPAVNCQLYVIWSYLVVANP